MKKQPLSKRSNRHDSMVAPQTNSSGISKMPDSPKYSKKLENTEIWGKGKLFLTVLKILVLVLVAVVTNRMVVSLSMSAFSLFFVEHVVKYMCGLYKNLFVSQTMKKTTSFSWIEGDNSTGDSFISDSSSLNVSGEEMQDVQAEFDSDNRVSQEANSDRNKIFSFGNIDSSKRVIEKDKNCHGEGSSTERRVCRREKMKSKFKKLLPKKIRRSMKRRSSSKREKPASSTGQVNSQVKEYVNQLDDEKDNINRVKSTESCQPIKSDSEESAVEAKPQRPTHTRSFILDYWFISFVVVAGLVQGQTLAVVLTVAWCLIMKLEGTTHMKSRELP